MSHREMGCLIASLNLEPIVPAPFPQVFVAGAAASAFKMVAASL